MTEHVVVRMRRVTLAARAGFVILGTCIVALSMASLVGYDRTHGLAHGDALWHGLSPIATIGVLAAGMVAIAARAPSRPALVLSEKAAVLPRGRFGGRPLTVPYTSIRSIAWVPSWPWPWRRLAIADDTGHGVIFRSAWFRGSALADFARALEERVADADPSGGRAAAVRARARVAEIASARVPVVTAGFMALVTVTVTAQWVAGPFDPAHLLAQGALARWLVADGEWHRALTAILLHSSIVHAAVNLGVIALLGPMVEGLVGAWRVVVVYVVAGLAGSAAALALGVPRAAVGASGAALGLIGALVALNATDRDVLPAPWWISWQLGLASLLALAALEIGYPRSATATHLGGLLGGALATLALRPGLDLADARRPASRAVKAVAALAMAVLVAGLISGLRAAWRSSPVDVLHRTAVALAVESPETLQFEAHASILSDQPAVGREDLAALMPIALERARERGGLSASVAADLAWLLGEPDRALALQERAALDPVPSFVLARLAALRFEGVRRGVLDPARLGAQVRCASPDGRVAVSLDAPWPEGFTLDALVLSGERLVGTLRIVRGGAGDRAFESRDPVLSAWPDPASLRLAVVGLRARRPTDEPAVAPGQAGYWPLVLDPDASRLPPPLPD